MWFRNTETTACLTASSEISINSFLQIFRNFGTDCECYLLFMDNVTVIRKYFFQRGVWGLQCQSQLGLICNLGVALKARSVGFGIERKKK